MAEKLLTREEIRREGMHALREKLGVRGMIEFLQDMGINRGNWTEDRKRILGEKSIDEIVKEIEAMKL